VIVKNSTNITKLISSYYSLNHFIFIILTLEFLVLIWVKKKKKKKKKKNRKCDLTQNSKNKNKIFLTCIRNWDCFFSIKFNIIYSWFLWSITWSKTIDVRNPSADLGQVQKCSGGKPVNGIPNAPIDNWPGSPSKIHV
jgi:hypothetical protein